jgi:polysaccharide biosynthesis/export protein
MKSNAAQSGPKTQFAARLEMLSSAIMHFPVKRDPCLARAGDQRERKMVSGGRSLPSQGSRFQLSVFLVATLLGSSAIATQAQYIGAPNITASAPAQDSAPTPTPAPSSSRNQTGAAPIENLSSSDGLGDGPIAPGDTVTVQVFDAPELSTRALVSQSGEIPIPLLKAFHIAGLTSQEAAAAIAHEFKHRDFLRDPNVLVMVQQAGKGITVAGEVKNPGVYPIYGKHRLIDVVTRAGGPTDNAAHVIEVAGPEPDQIQRVIWDPTFQENPASRVYLEAGQTVMVGKCGVVYMGGNLGRPAAYPLCGSRHTTLSEAIALAGGVRPSSSANKSVLLRNEQGTRTVRTVQVEDILRGKSPDFTLYADDILYVPGSAFKATAKILAQSALGFAAAVGAYRLQQ